MNSYHLEHPEYPRVYRFVPADGLVTVERWEGAKLASRKTVSRDDARRFYRYLWNHVGYRVFGFSKKYLKMTLLSES